VAASDDTLTAGSSLRGPDFAGPANRDADNKKSDASDVSYRQFDHTTIDREVVIVISLDSCHLFGYDLYGIVMFNVPLDTL